MEKKEEKTSPQFLEKNKKQANAYLKYSGIGFQMAIVIGGATFGGMKLDEYFEIKTVFTVICSLLGVGMALYVLIRQVLSENNQDKE